MSLAAGNAVTTVTAYIGEHWDPENEARFQVALKNLLWEHGVSSEAGNVLVAIDHSEVA